MRILRFITLALSGLIISFTITQAQDITGNGNIKEENRSLSGFNAIEVSRGVDVYITQGSAEKVTVKADENLINHLETKVSGNTLSITMDNDINIKKSTKLEAHVTVKDLNALTASSGSDIYIESTLKTDKLVVTASSGSDLDIKLDAQEFTCTISSGSDAKLSGKAGTFVANASSGSDISAKELVATKAKIKVSSGSDARIHVTGELEVEASSASDVFVSGNPNILSQKASGGADIHSN